VARLTEFLMGIPNYEVANVRVQRGDLDKGCADTGLTERRIQKTFVNEEDFIIII